MRPPATDVVVVEVRCNDHGAHRDFVFGNGEEGRPDHVHVRKSAPGPLDPCPDGRDDHVARVPERCDGVEAQTVTEFAGGGIEHTVAAVGTAARR